MQPDRGLAGIYPTLLEARRSGGSGCTRARARRPAELTDAIQAGPGLAAISS